MLSTLEDLDLFYTTKLDEKFPFSIYRLKKLKILRMRRTELEDLQEDSDQLKSLTEVDFQECRQFPKSLWKFGLSSNLQKLNLDNFASVRKLRDTSLELSNLEVLHLSLQVGWEVFASFLQAHELEKIAYKEYICGGTERGLWPTYSFTDVRLSDNKGVAKSETLAGWGVSKISVLMVRRPSACCQTQSWRNDLTSLTLNKRACKARNWINRSTCFLPFNEMIK